MNKAQLISILAEFTEADSIAEVINDCLPLREEPPNRRFSLREKVTCGNTAIYVEVGFYEDGRPCEVFLNAAKEGHTMRDLLAGLATVISISLQHSIPLSAYGLGGQHGNILTGQGSQILTGIFNTVEAICTSRSESSTTSSSSLSLKNQTLDPS